ncbi:MAG: thermosome subunit, partial [Euryarchaeota archaeon]|nr:thermosome subunit [Euryarchaeota archaeon]
GTTSAVVIAGELLKKAEKLLDQDVHPTVIVRGYRLAARKARAILEGMATDITPKDEEALRRVAVTSMTGRSPEKADEHLAGLVVEAVKAVAEVGQEGIEIDADDIQVVRKAGGGIEDSILVNGIIVEKGRIHPAMPSSVEKAKIALVNSPLEVEKTEIEAEIRISDPRRLRAFMGEEERVLRGMVESIQGAGATVLFCEKEIGDLAVHYLAKAGILAVRRVDRPDMEKLSKATGATIVANIEDLGPKDLGAVGLVEEVTIGNGELIFVKGCKDPKAVSILARGSTEPVVAEVVRAIEDCLGVVPAAMRDRKVVAGGGAPEIEVAKELRKYAKSVGGREQLAIEAFADAMEVIPRALAENAGLDPIDTLVDLRAKHEKDGVNYGIDVFEGKPIDMLKKGVIEPLRVKTQAVDSASEAAVMILRIDDVIAAPRTKRKEKPRKEAGPS